MNMNTNDNDNDIDLTALLTRLHACREGREWAAGKTLEQAWNECPRGDWLLWLAGRLDVDRKLLVRAACQCARLALPHVPAGEMRPLKALETAEAWTRGEATIKEVQAAAAAAEAAAAAADAAWAAAAAAAAWGAAWGAAEAAAEAWAAATAEAWAAATAEAWAAATADASAEAALESKLAECADIVREHVSYELIAEAARMEATK